MRSSGNIDRCALFAEFRVIRAFSFQVNAIQFFSVDSVITECFCSYGYKRQDAYEKMYCG